MEVKEIIKNYYKEKNHNYIRTDGLPDIGTGCYVAQFKWYSAKIYKPKEAGEYICWVAHFDFAKHNKATVESYNCEVRNFDGDNWVEEGCNSDGIVAWAEIPYCPFYLSEDELT